MAATKGVAVWTGDTLVVVGLDFFGFNLSQDLNSSEFSMLLRPNLRLTTPSPLTRNVQDVHPPNSQAIIGDGLSMNLPCSTCEEFTVLVSPIRSQYCVSSKENFGSAGHMVSFHDLIVRTGEKILRIMTLWCIAI